MYLTKRKCHHNRYFFKNRNYYKEGRKKVIGEMSIVSSIIESLHDVPKKIVSGLNELRRNDERSHETLVELATAESNILNDLKNAIGTQLHTYSRL
jgi:hypothetical protein